MITRTAAGEFTSSFAPDLLRGLDALRPGEDPSESDSADVAGAGGRD